MLESFEGTPCAGDLTFRIPFPGSLDWLEGTLLHLLALVLLLLPISILFMPTIALGSIQIESLDTVLFLSVRHTRGYQTLPLCLLPQFLSLGTSKSL